MDKENMFDDTMEEQQEKQQEVNEVEETNEEEQQEETFTKEQVKEQINNTIAKRMAREKRHQEKERQKAINEVKAPYEELEFLLRNAFDLPEDADVNTIKDSFEDYYNSQGYDIPKYNKPIVNNGLDEEEINILARYEANEVINDGVEAVEDEYNRLLSLDELSKREEIQKELYESVLAIEDAKKELEELGADTNILDDKDFQSFASQYNPNMKIIDIYKNYEKYVLKPAKPKYKPAGSMKEKANTKTIIKDYYTDEEIDSFTQEDFIKNPKLLDAVNRSLER